MKPATHFGMRLCWVWKWNEELHRMNVFD